MHTKIRYINTLMLLAVSALVVACDDPDVADDAQQIASIEVGRDGLLYKDTALNSELDMSLFVYDEKGELHAPIQAEALDYLSKGSEPSEVFYSMHNHFQGIDPNNSSKAWWLVHRDGSHGQLCAPRASFEQHCAAISAFVGANGWTEIASSTMTKCVTGHLTELYCATY